MIWLINPWRPPSNIIKKPITTPGKANGSVRIDNNIFLPRNLFLDKNIPAVVETARAAKVVANHAKKINSGMNNNNNKNMLFASGLGASIVGLLTPSAAMAISITDPVFGDIQIWQFLVLTAGYWIGIEMYLDKKYDENTTPIMPTLKKKDEDEDE